MTSLRIRTFTAALTSGGGEIVTRVIAIVMSIVIARMLQPTEVGILGLATIIVGIISIVGYYPEMAAVTTCREDPDEEVAFAGTIIRALSVGALVVVVIAAFPYFSGTIAGGAEGARHLRGVGSIFVFSLLVELVTGYPSIILQRRLDLTAIAFLQPMQALIALVTSSALLIAGFGAVGVACGTVAGGAVVAILSWARLLNRGAAPPRWPRVATFSAVRRSAQAMFVGLFGGFLSERFDNVLVSTAIGPRLMSFYSMAWNAARTPANVFSRATSFVLIPTLAHLKDEPERVERSIRECLRYSYVLLAPVCAFFFAAAPDVVALVLGARWLPAAVPLRIMSISVLSTPILFVCAALLVATGRAQWTAISTTIHLLMLALLIPALARLDGVRGAALAELAAVAVLTVTTFATARIVTKRVTAETVRTPILPILCAFAAAAVGWFASRYLDLPVARFFVTGFVLVSVYYALLYVFGRDTYLRGLADLFYAVIFRRSRTDVAIADG